MSHSACTIHHITVGSEDWPSRLAWLTAAYCDAIEEELQFSWLNAHRTLQRARQGEIAEVLEKLVAVPACAHLLMAESAGQTVGYFLGLVKPCLAEEPRIVGYVNGLYVQPAFRRRKIADLMVAQGLQWFRSQGMRLAELYVGGGNAAASAFWKSRGFRAAEEVLVAVLDE